jgi:hypothetical protein
MIGIKACNVFYFTSVREARAIFEGDNSRGKLSQARLTIHFQS